MAFNDDFISIKLQGELGNQLFQWAAGYVASRKANTSLLVVSEPNQIRLNEFRLIQDTGISFVEEEVEISKEPNLLSRIESRFRSQEVSKVKENCYSEKILHYAEHEVLSPRSGLSLVGYFQSWKYLRGYEGEIRSSVKLLSPSEAYISLARVLSDEPFIGMHIRRGATGKAILNTNFHGLLPTDYYKSALETLVRFRGSIPKKLVIFTDNKDEAMSIIEALPFESIQIIDQQAMASPGENLLLMSMSDGFIGANSSFSWWGAFLNQNQSCGFIFPRPWYKQRGIPEQENLYPHWISIGFEDFLE